MQGLKTCIYDVRRQIMTTRVAVTGIGAISPVGLNSIKSWESIKNGK